MTISAYSSLSVSILIGFVRLATAPKGYRAVAGTEVCDDADAARRLIPDDSSRTRETDHPSPSKFM
ncbi:hypothetical protein AB0F15_23745 [Amycolatopsis sp. NPDC026612]|uniref:hypothetical protein n=1 Tax=Amycolatopsis sp. NPDC026612 TaxID=3155466 RepID=UPI0033D4B886